MATVEKFADIGAMSVLIFGFIIATYSAAQFTNAPTLPETTTPPTTTTPPSTPRANCITDNGQMMYPGQELFLVEEGACKHCRCEYNGELMCYYGDCLPPMCVDPVRPPGACCYTCPNGMNCRLPSGEVIPSGAPVYFGGMRCVCPPQSYMLPGVHLVEHYTAICTAYSTTTVPSTTTTTTTTTPTVKRR